MAEETGNVYLGHGRDASSIIWDILSIHTDQANNANGSAGTHLVTDKAKFNALANAGEIPIMTRPGPHRVAGELLYLGLKADAADALVSANETIEIHELVRDANGIERTLVHTAANNYTTTDDGGIADNASTVVGQIIPVAAWRPLKPGEEGKCVDFFRYVSADA